MLFVCGVECVVGVDEVCEGSGVGVVVLFDEFDLCGVGFIVFELLV